MVGGLVGEVVGGEGLELDAVEDLAGVDPL